MATEINKGKISTIEGNTAKIIPSTASASVSRPLVIPWYLRGSMGGLEVGLEVVFCVFDDMSGIILARVDGNWPGKIPDDITITGKVTTQAEVTMAAAVTMQAAATATSGLTVNGVAMQTHTHVGAHGETSGPH